MKKKIKWILSKFFGIFMPNRFRVNGSLPNPVTTKRVLGDYNLRKGTKYASMLVWVRIREETWFWNGTHWAIIVANSTGYLFYGEEGGYTLEFTQGYTVEGLAEEDVLAYLEPVGKLDIVYSGVGSCKLPATIVRWLDDADKEEVARKERFNLK